MFCSTIIPTIGRKKLARTVNSVLTQNVPGSFEVIVVNDSGRPLPDAPWMQDPRVTILHTNRRERCVARNTGAAFAHGKYLHFLDDDDWLLPGALQAMYDLAQETDAKWLYGGTQLVDRDDAPLIQLHNGWVGNIFTQVMTGEWIPLQSSLISSDIFFAVGEFDPAVVGGEDVDLLRRIAFVADVAETQTLVACLAMGDEETTTDYGVAWKRARKSKLSLLNKPNAYSRLQQSAGNPFWQGKVVRLYLTDTIERFKSAEIATGLKRMLRSMLAGFSRPRGMLAAQYWEGLLTQYTSESFLRGFSEANLAVKYRVTRFGVQED